MQACREPRMSQGSGAHHSLICTFLTLQSAYIRATGGKKQSHHQLKGHLRRIKKRHPLPPGSHTARSLEWGLIFSSPCSDRSPHVINQHSLDLVGSPTKRKKEKNVFFFNMIFYLFIYFFGCTGGMWKFLGQGSNLHHSSKLSCCGDNAVSLMGYATRELLNMVFLKT